MPFHSAPSPVAARGRPPLLAAQAAGVGVRQQGQEDWGGMVYDGQGGCGSGRVRGGGRGRGRKVESVRGDSHWGTGGGWKGREDGVGRGQGLEDR